MIEGKSMTRSNRVLRLLLSWTCITMLGSELLFGRSDPSRVCVSLGEVCSPAIALRTFNLRQAAYPFDWIISRTPCLFTTLRQDFGFFLAEPYLRVRSDNHGVINKDGLEFVHDFPTINYVGTDLEKEDWIKETVLRADWKQYLPDVQKKYARRIERFRSLCTSNKKVYFIRHFGTTRSEAIQIRNLIKQLYPSLDFILVVIHNNYAEFAYPWGEENIRNYYFNDQIDGWEDVAQWKRIFESLGLLSRNKKYPIANYMQRYQEALCGHCDYCRKRKF